MTPMPPETTPKAELNFAQKKTLAIVGGLNLMNQYSDELMIEPAHDELFAGFEGLDGRMSSADKQQMTEWGWHNQEDNSFSIFT